MLGSSIENTYIHHCWSLSSPYSLVDVAIGVSNTSIDKLLSLTERLSNEYSGFIAFTVLFAVSTTISLLCLYYLLKNWKRDRAHIIVFGFSLLISMLNGVAFMLKAITVRNHISDIKCPAVVATDVFELLAVKGDPESGVAKKSLLFTVIFPVVFLWVTDVFLIYRVWVVWTDRRLFVLFPMFLFVASIVLNAVTMIINLPDIHFPHTFVPHNIYAFTGHWVPALAFSCGLDVIATSMIAGRLTYYHTRIRKAVIGPDSPYLPVIVIFIESAALSTMSKILQLVGALTASFGPSYAIFTNVLFIPLCTISSNLIILRKVLVDDIGKSIARKHNPISTFRVKSRIDHADGDLSQATRSDSGGCLTIALGENFLEDTSRALNLT